MSVELAFSMASGMAMLGWLLLAVSLFAPASWQQYMRLVGGRVIPALLAAGYVTALAAWWGWAPADAGFGSLAAVAALFSVPGLLFAGWVHYLAFDLLVARWQIDDNGAHGLAAWWLLPCLLLTFLFGPAGWLLYLLVRWVRRGSARRQTSDRR